MANQGTEARVHELPECDFGHLGQDQLAEYDFRTKGGSWAYGCEAHWVAQRMYVELGTGKGQRLVIEGSMRYAVERVLDGRWQVIQPDYGTRREAVAEMGRLIEAGEAVRGQIQVADLIVGSPRRGVTP